MNFCEKIDEVLRTNKLGISSIGSLEGKIGVSNGTIQKPYNKKRHPGLGTVKKIIELLRINQKWWDRGEGAIYLEMTDETGGKKVMDMDVWEVLKGNNLLFQCEFDRLWGLIDRLVPPAVPPMKKEPVQKNGN